MGLIPGATVILGENATAAAVGSYVIGVMTLFGAMFGINGPKIATEMQDFTGRMLNGELLGTSWEKNKAVGVEQKYEVAEQSAQLQPVPVVVKHTSRILSERPANST